LAPCDALNELGGTTIVDHSGSFPDCAIEA
jgi:hypothetical protein